MNYIGIDLGTTNSVAFTIKHGSPEYIKFSGKELLPSVILSNEGKIIVGSGAKRRGKINADRFISSAKTYMGDNNKSWDIDGRKFTPTDVAAEILKEIYKTAQKFFGNNDPIEAIITTPAEFSFDQNAATKKAGEMAGFQVKQILAEPIAAALAYALDNQKNKEKIYVVDLGGGTFDVALLEYDKSANASYSILFKDGDRKLGGDDFDKAVANLLMGEVRKTVGVDLASQEKSRLSFSEYAKTQQKLFTEAEKIKCALSSSESEQVDIVNLFPYQGGFYDLHMTITREAFLKEAAPLVRRVENIIRSSFEDSGYNEDDVDRVVLVGGSANMPFVRACVKKLFDKEPYANMDLSKLVAMGAAILADAEMGTGIEIHDLIAHSMGIEIIGNRMDIMLQKGNEFPCEISKTFYTVYDYQESVDIMAYEGEATEDLAQNRYIGGFNMAGIERALSGKEIEVRFAFDKSCILHVSAKDPVTGVYKEADLDPTMEQRRPETKSMPYDIVLLLDNSGSMYGSLDIAKDACKKLITDMIDTSFNRIALITFESSVKMCCHLTHNEDDLIAAIAPVNTGFSTAMAEALYEAQQELEYAKNIPLIILVTDGMPDNKYNTSQNANRLKEQGVKIATIGAGNVDHNYLSSLATSPDDYYPIQDMNGLAGAFQSITNGLRQRN